ncbi:hypothetical protein D3C81_2291840 [compost metagenome]
MVHFRKFKPAAEVAPEQFSCLGIIEAAAHAKNRMPDKFDEADERKRDADENRVVVLPQLGEI